MVETKEEQETTEKQYCFLRTTFLDQVDHLLFTKKSRSHVD